MSLRPVERRETDTAPADAAASGVPARTDQPAATGGVPATRPDMPLAVSDADRRPSAEWRQPVSVALLPLALVTFLVLAFAMALWTFLIATT